MRELSFNGHRIKAATVEGSDQALYMCTVCRRYAHMRWKGLKQPCRPNPQAERPRKRALEGWHPESDIPMTQLQPLTREQRLHVASKMPEANVELASEGLPSAEEPRVGGRPFIHWQLLACYGVGPAQISELLARAEAERDKQERKEPEEQDDPWDNEDRVMESYDQ